MLKALIVIIAAFLMTPPLAAHAVENAVKLTDLKIIPLHDGINKLRAFSSDGRDGVITKAWRENGNAHSFIVYSVLMKGQDKDAWTIASIWDDVDDNDEKFAILEYPFDGELYYKSIRFAKGKINGERATLLITAQRDLDDTHGYSDLLYATIRIYRLMDPDPKDETGGFGHPEYYFKQIETRKTIKQYCNSDAALTLELGLPPVTNDNMDDHPDGCHEEYLHSQ